MRSSLHMAVCIAAVLAASCAEVPESSGEPLATARSSSNLGPTRRALLVACGTYPALPERNQLHGPPHDIKLFANLLEKNQNFHFPRELIVQLADGMDARHRPTRANILRELDALAAVAGTDDQVVILLGGHGTQQPNAGNLEDGEADGMDEVFLPVDMVAKYDAKNMTIPNAITDDEMGEKLTAIRRKGAFVWVIFDCCHSGTMIRGLGDPVERHIPIEEIIPADVLQSVQPLPAGDGSRGVGDAAEDSPVEVTESKGEMGGLVAIYAALPTEKTYDDSFPKDVGPKLQTRHGLLTYAICQVLDRASGPLTYVELIQRVRQQYAQWRWTAGPTPTVAGPNREQEILGEKSWPGRSAIRLETVGSKLELSAGALAGLSPGAILAVLPLNGPDDAQPLGHLKVTECSVLRSTVIPHELAGIKPPEKFPEEIRLEVVRVDFGARKLRVAEERPAGAAGNTGGLLASLSTEGNPARDVVEIVADPTKADWIVRTQDEQGWLIPAVGWSAPRQSGPVERSLPTTESGTFGPYQLGENLGKQLGDTFSTIARAQNLLALSEPTDGGRLSASMRVDLTVTRHSGIDDEKGKPLDLSRGKISLQPGELLGFNIANKGKKSVDVTLLFVNSGFGIKAWYPKDGDFNRLAPDEQIGPPDISFARINQTTLGLEHMVLIAVAAAKDTPLDFTWLAQPTLQAARDVPGVRGDAFDSPLGQLLENAAYSPAKSRDAEAVEVRQSCIRTLAWKVE